MTTVNLNFRNATDTWQIALEADEDETIESLCERLVVSLNLPLAEQSSRIGQILPMVGNSFTLYHPRHGILEPQKSIEEYSSLYNDPWVVSVEYELADLLSSLHLAIETENEQESNSLDSDPLEVDSSFETLVRLATVKWENDYYPVLLPAQATPQGHIEGSLLSTVVVQQINRCRRVTVDPARLPFGHYYNLNTRREIDPFDSQSLIGALVNHGDLLEYRTTYPMPQMNRTEIDITAPDLDIVILDRPEAPAPDASLLDSITISPVEEDNSL